ncbi:MAG: hypothetical protein K8R77_03935 [Anaerolineaceae bacterium]|nr:hypothetical protein [Anaerolineaceae bacterium]
MSTTDWMNSKAYFVAYSLMINAAQHQGFTTYQEIAQAVGLPTVGSYMGKAVGDLIGAISQNEVEMGRPMLSAIVVNVDGKPGTGFIPWAQELGLFKEGDDENTFWENECQKIYEEWKISYRTSYKK